MSEQPRHQFSPAELKEQLAAERRGTPFLVYRDGAGEQRIVELDAAGRSVTVGRSAGVDVSLHWDADVSRIHAELQPVGDTWAVIDDGLSRNGTFVNRERVRGRRRLTDGDAVRCGQTLLCYRAPGEQPTASTAAIGDLATARISDAQRRVLVALARPYAGGNAFAAPASNLEIAAELFLSVPAVKTHLRTLFQKFGIEELPPNQKRARLVALAFQSGEITERDLDPRTRG
jgi:DNA-binding CsgD family transcriptional regulator